jgi:hypothetical protein
MQTIILWLSAIGANIVSTIIELAILALSVIAGVAAAQRTNKWIGIAVGVAVLACFFIIFGPILEAAIRIGCRASDNYEECMEGGPE